MTAPLKKPDEWDRALEWAEAGHGVALASVIDTWGSSPRPVGSLLAIRGDGLFEGSVSGGCVEGAVITEAADLQKSGQCGVLEFGIENAKAWDVGLACGGKISILVAPLKDDEIPLLKTLIDLRRKKAPLALATRLSDGAKALYHENRIETPKQDDFWQSLAKDAAAAMRGGGPGIVEKKGGQAFLNPLMPPRRMFVIGAVHVAQALLPMARLAGYEVSLADPRGAFAEGGRFPDIAVTNDWPDEFLEKAALNERDAVITLTHDPKLDEAALKVALKSPCFYIGSLGSRKTHAARLERLAKAGFPEKQLTRIHGPVGLAIGAKTPAEIAVSILAQVTEARRATAEK